jgi:hypothetical protein
VARASSARTAAAHCSSSRSVVSARCRVSSETQRPRQPGGRRRWPSKVVAWQARRQRGSLEMQRKERGQQAPRV